MTDFDDLHYIRLVTSGDNNAFVHIVRRYQKMIFTIVCKIVSDNADAEDITQEVFIKVFQSLNKFREESGFSTWLYRIAYNTTISEIRKKKKEFIPFDDKYMNLPDDDISNNINEFSTEERLKYLDIVLRKLNPDDAMLITLFYLNNQSIEEISTITSLSRPNVKVKLHRIRKFMNFEINKLISQ